MIATGIDILSVKRIKESLQKDSAFIKRFFGEDEQKLFASKKTNNAMIQTIAVNFAGKEAFSKALGTGIRGFKLSEVEILRDEWQAPYIKLSGNALCLPQVKNKLFSISLSHTSEYAAAVVILYDTTTNCKISY